VDYRQKEQMKALKYYYPENSAVAEHSIEYQYKIIFEETKILHLENKHRLVLEAVEIKRNHNNVNKENGFILSDMWK
jgi:hypothetical protein